MAMPEVTSATVTSAAVGEGWCLPCPFAETMTALTAYRGMLERDMRLHTLGAQPWSMHQRRCLLRPRRNREHTPAAPPEAVYALSSAVAALADSRICTYGGKLVTLPNPHDVLPMMLGRTRTCCSRTPALSCAAAFIARGAVMCRLDGALLWLLCSMSCAVRVSVLGRKTPFAKVAGSSALFIGKLGPAAKSEVSMSGIHAAIWR